VEMCARVSPVAMGLMQIMPNASAGSRSRRGLGVDSFDARDNILAGVAYLQEMHRPLRAVWVSGSLQCRPQALRGVPGDGSSAAERDAALRHDTRANDRRDAG
jgi:hypothetical protein